MITHNIDIVFIVNKIFVFLRNTAGAHARHAHKLIRHMNVKVINYLLSCE